MIPVTKESGGLCTMAGTLMALAPCAMEQGNSVRAAQGTVAAQDARLEGMGLARAAWLGNEGGMCLRHGTLKP